ncbi:MAG: hypothetical protein ACXVBE_08365 [Bdellovibrionota bacterium]
MNISCPKCLFKGQLGKGFVRDGYYFRTSDSRHVQRFLCKKCEATTSAARLNRWFRAKKRRQHEALRKHFASLGAIRRGAHNMKLNRKTVARKLILLGEEAEERVRKANLLYEKARVVEFDDLETFEHSKCKPLSVTLAVQSQTRRILGFEVSSMPAKGRLAKKARIRYGYRRDNRRQARERLFKHLRLLVHEEAMLKSDAHPHYPRLVRKFFPKGNHVTFMSRKGSLGGGGELKEGGFDPLFSLNHTCASFRMNVTRLLRKTWYTTKRADRLSAHLWLYADFHNSNLEQN